jgi:hypothetical protein
VFLQSGEVPYRTSPASCVVQLADRDERIGGDSSVWCRRVQVHVHRHQTEIPVTQPAENPTQLGGRISQPPKVGDHQTRRLAADEPLERIPEPRPVEWRPPRVAHVTGDLGQAPPTLLTERIHRRDLLPEVRLCQVRRAGGAQVAEHLDSTAAVILLVPRCAKRDRLRIRSPARSHLRVKPLRRNVS